MGPDLFFAQAITRYGDRCAFFQPNHGGMGNAFGRSIR